jgi:hypothetical protein
MANRSNALFTKGEFTSHSGVKLSFKIDCDFLTDDDLDCLAWVFAVEFPYRHVWSVPTGGDRWANALRRYLRNHGTPALDGPVIIADDVLTTSASMEEKRLELAVPEHARGVVLFARGPCPDWIQPIFTLNPRLWHNE